MNVKTITIDPKEYASTKWYSVEVELEDGTKIEANIMVTYDSNPDNEEYEVNINSDLPEGLSEEELQEAIEEAWQNN